jgi:selenocysteine-specific elongation factor
MAAAAQEAVRRQIADAAVTAGATGVDLAALSAIQRSVLATGVPGVTVTADRVVDAALVTTELSSAATRALAALDAAPWSPPPMSPADRGALRELERAGLAVEVGDLWFSAAAVDEAAVVIADLLADQPRGVTVSATREALQSSRKYVMPLLAHLDATGMTRRRGDVRIAGPRLGSKVRRR